ncbi:hypothetical protein M2475_000844 [Breznakia sp. PF5-3]|uniref:ABC-three component system middle component 2 n=1 Tax=unclassified Breznakia TaxID=2623764 RepID=UPI0024049F75|nr:MULTISPECIES: ABC-three component system middle component 2 [unclassified Breznakia]MDF9824493.1 hypothetical protein [Breznakia sp. PM6-1]MDF9835279.1 hypothetical protein [Breznakia sp. PF5-3]MDF9836995.1 hypothetical protein [Breznakia sp. PFB2-8]MDF9858920.1 hypothetical protein [Breznakia sp. PH5-24]
MKEIVRKVSYQEFILIMLRLISFLNCLGMGHKKNTTRDRMALYDFYLKFPELINQEDYRPDFDTEFSYFYWVPNYTLYSSVLINLEARGLIHKDENGNYSITELGTNFIGDIENPYLDRTNKNSKFLISNICKLSNKDIISDINNLIYKERGL